MAATTLAGGGTIRRRGDPASGGGGRVAVYALDFSGFNTTKITAPGRDGGLQHGARSTSSRASLTPTSAPTSPYGVEHGFVDQGNGYVNQPIDSITLKFNNPIDLSTFDPSKFLINGQMGRITPTGDHSGRRLGPIGSICPSAHRERSLQLHAPLDTLKDAEGFPLDQNANGIPGEPLADDYSFTLTVDTVPPRITHQDPAGDLPARSITLTSGSARRSTRRRSRRATITIVKPDGTTVAATSIQNVGLNRFRISFPAQTLVGTYHVKIGPNITDLAGNLLDQNGRRHPRRGDLTSTTEPFNLVPVDLGLNTLTVQPSGPSGPASR